MSSNDIMTGGRPTEQIDADFANPDKTMKLSWDGKQWRWTHEDWYNFLDITPDYLIEKCRAKGLDADETLRAWNNMLHYVRRSRAPTEKEKLGSKMWNANTGREEDLKYFKEIPEDIKNDIERYHNTVDKEAEQTAYQQCNLTNGIEAAERNLCRGSVLCRPSITLDGVDIKRTVYNDADYESIENSALPETEKNKYRRCRALKETCPEEFVAGTEYYLQDFSYISNGGSGDCLFIAVHHYKHLCEQLGAFFHEQEFYPVPGVDSGFEDMGLEDNKLQTLDYKTLRENAKILRNLVCDYYKEHPNYILFEGRSIKHELAILNIEGGIYNDSAYIEQYNAYVNSIQDNFFGLEPIPDGTRNIFSCPQIVHATSIINLDKVDPELQDAWDDFTLAMYNNYIKKMRHDSTYGGNAEITVLSKILQKNIFVLQTSEEEGSVHLTANMGARYAGTDDTMYIYHNAGVTGHGSLHYEVMFPLDHKYIDGSALDASSILEAPSYMDISFDVDADADDNIEVDDGLDEVRSFIGDQCGLDVDGEDEGVVIVTLEGCLNDPNLDKKDAIKLYFNHNVQHNRNADVFEMFHDILFTPSETEIDQDVLYNALLSSGTVDVVSNNILPYINEKSNIFRTQYTEWFNMLNQANQEKLLLQLLNKAIDSVNIKTYDSSNPPDTYDTNAENRLILYTTATKSMQNIASGIKPFPNPIINDSVSIIHSIISVRRSYETIMGETTRLDNNMLKEYKEHWNLDEDDEPNYDDDDDIEPILEITLLKQIAETIQGLIYTGVSDELTQLVLALRYHIVKTYSQMLPTITLICKKKRDPPPPMLIPTEENTALSKLLDYVSVMERYVNVIADPS